MLPLVGGCDKPSADGPPARPADPPAVELEPVSGVIPGDSAPALRVEVFNATGRAGLARTATRLLRSRGYDVVMLGNSEQRSDVTQVIVRRGDEARADALREALGAGKVTVQPDTLRRVDITVRLGADFRPALPYHP